MAISTLGTTSRTIIQMTASNAGIHSFSVGNLSGFLSVRATDPITVILGRSTASAGTIAGQSGTTFQLGADNFDTILIYATNVGTEVVVDFIPVTSSTATTTPAWLSLAGYLFSGNQASSYHQNPTKVLFPVDTVSVSNPLPSGRQYASGAANSGVAGYLFAGYTAAAATATNSIDQYTFPTDTSSTLTATTVGLSYSNSAFANSGTAAFFANGYQASVLTNTAIQRFAFPTMTRTIATATANAGYGRMTFVNGHDSGYLTCGANTAVAGSETGTVRRYYFATDVAVNTANSMSWATASNYTFGSAGSHHGNMAIFTSPMRDATLAYAAVAQFYECTWMRYWLYSTDTQVSTALRFFKPITNTYGGYSGHATVAHSGNATYFCGGSAGNNAAIQTIEKVDMPTLSTARVTLLTSGMSQAGGAYQNSNQSFENIGIF